jgi:hypothetical protein
MLKKMTDFMLSAMSQDVISVCLPCLNAKAGALDFNILPTFALIKGLIRLW